jgi:myo-inositol catabolism protein IolC
MTVRTRPTASQPLLILAMDHRDSFAKLFGAHGPATPEQDRQMETAKLLIYHGVRDARSELGEAATPGVLVDEELGAQVLREARADGLAVAMPVEKSGQKLFTLAYGDDTGAHIEEFDPDYIKVLVRMNPDDDPDETQAQLAGLSSLSNRLRQQDRAFIYELLVAATDAQLAQAGGDKNAYDRDVRPDLVCRVIGLNQQAGVEPTLWKIEGLETREAARQVVAAAKTGGRDADCIVLGRDAPQEVLDHWLRTAAPVDGFVGFAVGRSIWEDALEQHLKDGDDDALTGTVKANYLHYAHTYLDAR